MPQSFYWNASGFQTPLSLSASCVGGAGPAAALSPRPKTPDRAGATMDRPPHRRYRIQPAWTGSSGRRASPERCPPVGAAELLSSPSTRTAISRLFSTFRFARKVVAARKEYGPRMAAPLKSRGKAAALAEGSVLWQPSTVSHKPRWRPLVGGCMRNPEVRTHTFGQVHRW